MINILVVPSDNQGGVGFFRSTQPHNKLKEMYPDEFDITFDMNPNWSDLESFKKYDLIQIHKAVFFNRDNEFLAAMKFFKENNIATIMDIDDHWKLGIQHPQYYTQKHYNLDKLIQRNFGLFDYVTTTTPIFANAIKKYNKNVVVLANAIDPTDPRFQIHKEKSNRLRVGMIMGSSHEQDVAMMGNFLGKLPQEVRDKVSFVLCGFDTRGQMQIYNRETGEATSRPLMPKETVWYRYENMTTDNLKGISPQYKQFLDADITIPATIPHAEYPNATNEGYKRCWTKDINHYYEHYKEVDVLLAPLHDNEFNKMKSQLKVIECAFSNTAIVASNFGPYTIDLHNIFEKGGILNESGNAILVDESKNHKDWSKAIEKLVKNPELVTMLQSNLHKDICEKYDLKTITEQRAELYRTAVNNKKN